MDQLKPAIEWCKKNIFWIGCFLLAVTMIGSWVFSSMQLASQQKENQRNIESKISALNTVSGTTAETEMDGKAHPNESTKAGMDAEIDATISSIVKAWTKRYDEQKALLTWPEEELGKPTCDFFSKVAIPEKLADPGQGFEKFRRAYYERIPKFMNKICRDLDTNWQFDEDRIREQQEEEERQRGDDDDGGFGGGLGMGGGMGGMGDDNTAAIDKINRFSVIWDPTNQALWQQKLTDFAGYDDHSEAVLYPTFMQVNMLQQDLWLLEAMFNNIKAINGKSTSNDTSVIRTIDHLVFGREGIVQLGTLSQIDGRLQGSMAAGGAAAGPAGGMGMNMGDFDPEGSLGGGVAGGVAGATGDHEPVAYHNRYVDPEFGAIAASKVKAVLGGEELPEDNLELIVAKRVPFRLAVEIDERKINEFIAICANSEFVFEVNQLRINRHTPGEQIVFNGGAPKNDPSMNGPPGGMAGMGGAGINMGSMGAMGSLGGLGGMGSAGGTPSEELEPTPVETRTDFMVSVEFYGVVKIYNPVRENFLRKAAGQEVIDETADPSLLEPVAPIVNAAAPAAAAQPNLNAAATGQAAPIAAPTGAAAPAATPAGAAAPAAAPAGTAAPTAAPAGAAKPAGAVPNASTQPSGAKATTIDPGTP